MSLLNQSYDAKGNDDVQLGGQLEATVIEATISDINEVKAKGSGEPYLQLELEYKDYNGKTRKIRYQNFNPNKSQSGKQLLMNLLVVAKAKTPGELKGKEVKVVVRPEEYLKGDGGVGVTYKPVPNGYFSKDGVSAGGNEERMIELLEETLELGVLKIEAPAGAPAQESTEDGDSEPF